MQVTRQSHLGASILPSDGTLVLLKERSRLVVEKGSRLTNTEIRGLEGILMLYITQWTSHNLRARHSLFSTPTLLRSSIFVYTHNHYSFFKDLGCHLTIVNPCYYIYSNMSIKSVLLASASILLALPNADAYVTHGHLHQHRAPLGNSTFKSFAASSYRLIDAYHAGNFFNSFNFFQGGDPTHGFVKYQSRGDAQNQGLINENNNRVYMGVDSNTVNPSGGRNSVRVTSNKAYTHGLFIADIAHMPGAACGSWPAYWLFGPNWPGSGESKLHLGKTFLVKVARCDHVSGYYITKKNFY